ncbi:MAG: sigma-70 family RNA polymerase sigma factor, partial [Candidatus Dadabacteria bacterium]
MSEKFKRKKKRQKSKGVGVREQEGQQSSALPPKALSMLPSSSPPHFPSGKKAPVPYDPLSAYIRQIRRFAPLSAEEEHKLAVDYYEHKDIKAAYRLIASNLWLVVRIARHYQKAAQNLLDLIQEGNIGLMEALKNFNPYKGVRFPSYAAWWIKAYIIRYIMSNLRLVKIGTTQAQRRLFFNLKKEKEKLEKMGIKPDAKLLAKRLSVKEEEVLEMEQRLSLPELSLDSPFQEDSDGTLMSVLPADDGDAESVVARKEELKILREKLKEFVETLNDKEKIIFSQRINVDSEDKATLQVLSEQLGVSRERVRQIEEKIKDKLKDFLGEGED